MNTQVNQQDLPIYFVERAEDQQQDEDNVIQQALSILRKRINTDHVFDSPNTLKHYLAVHNAQYKDYEVFSVLFLDSQHRLIKHEDMFRGTLTQTSVYPREVVKLALSLNAAGVILCHNHPSCNPSPSIADRSLTQTLKSALALVDVRVLDHLITGADKTLSMAEMGLI